jgi:Putative viral replication protein
MPNGAKNWFYTLNNYTEDELEVFKALPPGATFHHFGKEVAKTGTPHLQGVLGFTKRTSIARIKKHLSSRLHLEPCRDVLRAIGYCSKEADTFTYGRVPTTNPSGSRSDLDAFKQAVLEGMYDFKELRLHHSSVVARYPRFCSDFVRDHRPVRAPPTHPLRPWQNSLEEDLSLPPDSRVIHFVVDLSGNTGKSWYCDFYHYRNPGTSQVLIPGKKADMAFALNPEINVLFIDAPRSKQGEFIQYDFLEDVKNGRVFSGKYESMTKYLGPCHVVVMMNEEPDYEKLSEDRYKIIKLN